MTHHTGGGHVSGDIHPICICPAARRRTEAQAMLRMDAMPCLTSAVTPSTVVRFEGGRLVSNAAVAAALRSRPACPGAACGCSRRGCSTSIWCLQQSRYCHLKMKIPLAVANSRMNSLLYKMKVKRNPSGVPQKCCWKCRFRDEGGSRRVSGRGARRRRGAKSARESRERETRREAPEWEW